MINTLFPNPSKFKMFNQSLLSYLILISLLFSTSNAHLSYFENCKQNEYPINLTSLNFDPNPIEIGKNLVTNISGISMKSIQSGSIMTANFTYDGQLVDSLQFDLCLELIEASGGKCPVEPGVFNITSNSIPSVGSNYPKNSTYTYDTTFTGKNVLLYNYNILIVNFLNQYSIS